MARATALWWWIDRWRKSSAFMDMTLEEQGAYRNLIDEATLRGGPLPNDERILGKACGDALAWRRVRPVVMTRFVLTADGWRAIDSGELFKRTSRWVPREGKRLRRPDIASWLRRLIFGRDRVCVICGSDMKLEIDHIERWRDGGGHTEDNLRVLCQPCNRRRG